MTIKFHIPGVAIPMSMKRKRDGSMYKTPKYAEWKKTVQIIAQNVLVYDWLLHEGSVTISCDFYLPRSKSNRDLCHIIKPDRSNLLKGIEDALEGIFYRNDSQIIDGSTRKFYADQWGCEPGVDVVLELHERRTI